MSHLRRMMTLGLWAAPKPGTPEHDKLLQRLNSPQGKVLTDEQLHDLFNRARASVALQLACGAGLPLDAQIREYNAEYNSRLFLHSIRDLPASFNVMEAFNRFTPLPAYFQIRQEKDHRFSFIDFLDYYTSSPHPITASSIVEATSEGVIYSYNVAGNLREFFIRTVDGLDFGIVGASLVRFGNEISMMLLVGRVCDLGQQSAQLQANAASATPAPDREHIVADPDRAVEATAVGGEPDFWKAIVLARIDLEEMSLDSRSVYYDIGSGYVGFTDDMAAYCGDDGRFLAPEFAEIARAAIEDLDRHAGLFDLCKTFLLLPQYFYRRETEATVERFVTEYGANRDADAFKGISALTDAASRVAVRNVLNLAGSVAHPADSVSFLPPDIRIEKSGYWKRIAPDAVGEDKHSRPIRGRTWVHQHLSWVESKERSESLVARRPLSLTEGRNPGYIYVMRSAAHPRDLFKIGLTRRSPEQRAAELTRDTSAPDQFLVVQDWAVSDCVLAEERIHRALEGYRINPRREFFSAPYRLVCDTIAKIIAEVDSGPDGR